MDDEEGLSEEKKVGNLGILMPYYIPFNGKHLKTLAFLVRGSSALIGQLLQIMFSDKNSAPSFFHSSLYLRSKANWIELPNQTLFSGCIFLRRGQCFVTVMYAHVEVLRGGHVQVDKRFLELMPGPFS